MEILKESKYHGFLFVGCTPQIIEMKIEFELKNNGLDDKKFEIVNIREQCSWVHSTNEANYKALILIKALFNKLMSKDVIRNELNTIEKTIIIIGAGIAGLQVAINLQNKGYTVYLLEKEQEIGGFVSHLPIITPYNVSGREFIKQMITRIDKEKIKIINNCYIDWITGELGNYTVKLVVNKKEDLTLSGSIIVFATGHEMFVPNVNDFYGYNRLDEVITLSELGNLLNKSQIFEKQANNTEDMALKLLNNSKKIKRILIIQCVGSRDKNNYEYCSKYCCLTAINYSIELLKRFPDLEISISYIDIRTTWTSEYNYRTARELGVNFIRGKVGALEKYDDGLIVSIYDSLLQKLMKLEVDLVVLSTALTPNNQISPFLNSLHLKVWNKGFIKSKYLKLRNIETNRIGIYACGTALGPKLIAESLTDANAVSLEVIKLLDRPELFKSKNITIVDPNKCNGCELCARVCPFNIPIMVPRNSESQKNGQSVQEVALNLEPEQ